MNKGDLDKRICDVVRGGNTQTYREFIRETEVEMGLDFAYIDSMTDYGIVAYVEFLDDLWNK